MHFLLQSTTPTADIQSLPQTTKPHHLQPLLFKPHHSANNHTLPLPNHSFSQTTDTLPQTTTSTADSYSLPQTTTPQHSQRLLTTDHHSLPQITAPARRQPCHRLPLPTQTTTPNADPQTVLQTATPHHKQPLSFADNHSLAQTTTTYVREPLPTADNHSLPQTTTPYRRQPLRTAEN